MATRNLTGIKRLGRRVLRASGLRWTPGWVRADGPPRGLPLQPATAPAPDTPTRLLPCDSQTHAHQPGNLLMRYSGDQSGEVAYQFNSAGYRSEELDLTAEHRILLVGESHAFGMGVSFEDGFGQRLKTHMAEALGLPDVQVNLVNLSVCAASADYCTRTLIRQVDIVRPNLVLCCLPVFDRIENYTKRGPRDYSVSGIDPAKLDSAPIPVQGFIDLYNPLLGRMNQLRNVLLLQSLCARKGIEHLVLSEDLRPGAMKAEVLQPVFGQVDQERVALHRFFRTKIDLAKDDGHSGPRTHAALAIFLLDRIARLPRIQIASDRGARLLEMAKQLKAESPDWAFAMDAVKRF